MGKKMSDREPKGQLRWPVRPNEVQPSPLGDLDSCPPEALSIAGDKLNGEPDQGQAPPGLDFAADPQLTAQGWERRFMADPIRAQEATHLYTELGFEVLAEPITPSELSVVCGDCRLATCRAYVTIYTRKLQRHD